jgi:hypothetical protein
VGVVFSHGVNLDIETISRQKFLVYEGSFSPDRRFTIGREELTAIIFSFSEKNRVARATWTIPGVVNVNLVVLSVDRFLKEGFFKFITPDYNVFVVLCDLIILVDDV